MFERAAIFSGIFVLSAFSILSIKYHRLFNHQGSASTSPEKEIVISH